MSLDVRAAAAGVLGDVLGGRSLQQALPARLDAVSARDQGLLRELCYGTLRQAPRLQALLARLLERPLRERDRDVQGLLLCGFYQLDNMRVPDHAAVAETVGATRALGKPWAKGMANAVLRRYLREREQLLQALEPAAAAAHPRWLFQAIMDEWPGSAAAILDANNQQAPMTLRVNAPRLSREDCLARLRQAGLDATAGAISPQAVQLSQPVDVWQLPGFAEGDLSVQDEAAQLAAQLLQPRAGERVLDACAAPGGKTCHLLELQPALAELVAMDIDAERLRKVSDNLHRLGLSATLLTGDGAQPPPQLLPHSFDRILVDAPCSASGVLRRNPDIKLLRRARDIPQLAALQLRILEGLWPLLKPGGTLLYATCSILAAENSDVVRRFLDAHDDAALQPLDVTWGEPAGCGRQLLPAIGGPDGLFHALLQKRG